MAELPFCRSTHLLDPRPSDLATASPIEGAATIPWDELTRRTHELPLKTAALEVLDADGYGDMALRALESVGRTARLISGPFEEKKTDGVWRLWRPNAFLEEQVADLEPGTALDLACGSGRDAVFLADLGWEVTAIDWLPDGLDRARDLEARYASHPVHWQQADLRSWHPTGSYDLAMMFFWLNRPLLQALRTRNILVETFTPTHREQFGKPAAPDLVTTLEEITELLPGYDLLSGEEGWTEKGHTVRFHGIRNQMEPNGGQI